MQTEHLMKEIEDQIKFSKEEKAEIIMKILIESLNNN